LLLDPGIELLQHQECCRGTAFAAGQHRLIPQAVRIHLRTSLVNSRMLEYKEILKAAAIIYYIDRE
jgi:hypothetical protein